MTSPNDRIHSKPRISIQLDRLVPLAEYRDGILQGFLCIRYIFLVHSQLAGRLETRIGTVGVLLHLLKLIMKR